MSITVQCVHCQGRFGAHDRALGHVLECPKCGNSIKVEAPIDFDESPVVQVTLKDVEQATASSGSGSNSAIIGVCVIAALLTVFIVGVFALKPSQDFSSVAEAESVDTTISAISPARKVIEIVGLGFSLDEFKKRIANDHWKVVEEVTRDDGSVYCRLSDDQQDMFSISASGDPRNLDEVTGTIAIYRDITNDGELFGQLAVISIFLERLSIWTYDEINAWIAHIIVGGKAHQQAQTDNDYFRVNKNGYELNLHVVGGDDGALMFITMKAKPKSKAPSLESWMELHPNPPPTSGKTHYHAAQTRGRVENARFTFRNLHEKAQGGDIIGEIQNETGRSYTVAFFKISIYDTDGRLLDTPTFSINNFKPGETRSFQLYVDDLPGYYSYKIDLDHGL